MKYVISGASAQIGQLATQKLLKRVAPSELTLITRSPSALATYSDLGVNVLAGHHGEAESLRKGYKDADAVLMISSRAGGKRAEHHKECIRVAKEVGVKHITYTSCAGVHPSNPTPSSADHLATEYHLFESGLSFAALRNQTYSDMLYDIIKKQVLPKKRMVINCLKGAFSPISRNDIANCAADIMLATHRHDRVTYEITGPERFTWPDIIDLASKVWQTELKYISISTDEMFERMERAGVPFEGNPNSEKMHEAMGAEELTLQADGYELGFLDVQSAAVKWITGYPAQSLESVWRELQKTQDHN